MSDLHFPNEEDEITSGEKVFAVLLFTTVGVLIALAFILL